MQYSIASVILMLHFYITYNLDSRCGLLYSSYCGLSDILHRYNNLNRTKLQHGDDGDDRHHGHGHRRRRVHISLLLL